MSEQIGLGYANLAPTRNPFNYDRFEQINRDIATPWLSLEEIQNQLNLFTDDSQSAYLAALELAVRMAIEDYLGMAIAPVTYRVYYGIASLYGTPLSLDLPEVSQGGVVVDSVGYYGEDHVFVTLPADAYYYDPTGSKIIVNSMPSEINSQMTSPVVAEYTLAANPVASYPVVKQAGLLFFTHLYNNRSDSTELNLKKIPFGVDALLRPYKELVM